MRKAYGLVFFILFAWLASASTTITFNGLGGNSDDPYSSYSESGYTVTSTGGDWFVAKVFGNPVPDIYLGPVFSPTNGTVSVTGSPFTFDSVDLSSNNGESAYTYSGYLGGILQFTGGLTLPNEGSTGSFATYDDPLYSGILIDDLQIALNPGSGTTSVNLDNIVLNATAPEPGSFVLLGTGILGLVGMLRRKRTN